MRRNEKSFCALKLEREGEGEGEMEVLAVLNDGEPDMTERLEPGWGDGILGWAGPVGERSED